MPDDIDGTGWFVILCALALGFGLVRFLLSAIRDRQPPAQDAPPDQERGNP